MCVDDGTGCFVPLAELRTTNDVRFYTDSVGGVAITDPDLLDCAIYLKIASLGKTCSGDSFGNHGAVLLTFRKSNELPRSKLRSITESAA